MPKTTNNHIKVHFLMSEADEAYLQRRKKVFEKYDATFNRDIREPIYQQLSSRQRNAYQLASDAIEYHRLTGDSGYFDRFMGYLDLAIHTSETLMQGILNRSGQPITVQHQQQQLTLPYCKLNKRISWLTWSHYLCQAISRRAHTSVDLLLKFSPELAMQFTDEPHAHTGFYVEYLKGMLSPDGDHDELQARLKQCHLKYPIRYRDMLAPFYHLAKENEAEFEKAIVSASKLNRAYAKKYKDKGFNPVCFYPPELLAAASLAFERHGWTLKHRNDYLPEWWIYNRFEAPEYQ